MGMLSRYAKPLMAASAIAMVLLVIAGGLYGVVFSFGGSRST